MVSVLIVINGYSVFQKGFSKTIHIYIWIVYWMALQNLLHKLKSAKSACFSLENAVHSPTIDCVSRLNQANFTSFFFTHKVLQSPLLHNHVMT